MKEFIKPLSICIIIFATFYFYADFEKKNSAFIDCGNRTCFISKSIFGNFKYRVSVQTTTQMNDTRLENTKDGLKTIEIYSSTGIKLKSKSLNQAIDEVKKIEI